MTTTRVRLSVVATDEAVVPVIEIVKRVGKRRVRLWVDATREARALADAIHDECDRLDRALMDAREAEEVADGEE